MTTTIILARHGETDWNRERRVQGHTDTPLNELGFEQARGLADALEGERIDAVYSSDLARARETAETVAARIGLHVTLDSNLREKNFGSWEGLTDTEVIARFPGAEGGAWGDAETSEELARRFVAALRRIAVAHPGEHVLVVAHGGPLRAVLRHCDTQVNGSIGNCQVIRLAVDGAEIRAL